MAALSLVFSGATAAMANEPLQEGQATLTDFALKSLPQWNFPRANYNDACWPESAFDGNGNPTDGGNVQNWPNSDGDCGPHGSAFPT